MHKKTFILFLVFGCGVPNLTFAKTFGCEVCKWVYNNSTTAAGSVEGLKDACMAWGKANISSATWTVNVSGTNSGYESCLMYTQDRAEEIRICKKAGKGAEQCCYEMTAAIAEFANNYVCGCSYTEYDSNYSSYCPNGNCSDGVKMTSTENQYCPPKYGCHCLEGYFPNNHNTYNYMGFQVCDCKSWCSTGAYRSGSVCKICPDGTYKNTPGNATSCTSCPSPGTTTGNTLAKDAVTDCYVEGGSDSTGTYEYNPECHYTE